MVTNSRWISNVEWKCHKIISFICEDLFSKKWIFNKSYYKKQIPKPTYKPKISAARVALNNYIPVRIDTLVTDRQQKWIL